MRVKERRRGNLRTDFQNSRNFFRDQVAPVNGSVTVSKTVSV